MGSETVVLVPADDVTLILVLVPGVRVMGACTMTPLSAAKSSGTATPSNVTLVAPMLVGRVAVKFAQVPPTGPRFAPTIASCSPGATPPLLKLDVLTMVLGSITGGPNGVPT